MPTAAMLATHAVRVTRSLTARFGSSALAFLAVSAAFIGQITSQIHRQKTAAAASQPIAGA